MHKYNYENLNYFILVIEICKLKWTLIICYIKKLDYTIFLYLIYFFFVKISFKRIKILGLIVLKAITLCKLSIMSEAYIVTVYR